MAVAQNLGMVAFLLASAVVGVRLLLLWRRTRELPELSIGLAFVLAGLIGGILLHLARVHDSGALGTAAIVCLHAGALCLAFFTWRVFRLDAAWARLAFGALAAGAIVAVLGGGQGTRGAAQNGAAFWIGFWCRALPFGWAAFESGLYFARMRRRVHLGLADAFVAQRFLFWAVGSGLVFWIFAQSAVLLALGADPNDGAPLLLRSVIGLGASAALWWAFFPPGRLRYAAQHG